jgi:hypothetical protein
LLSRWLIAQRIFSILKMEAICWLAELVLAYEELFYATQLGVKFGLIWLKKGPMTGYCGHVNEHLCLIKRGDLLASWKNVSFWTKTMKFC